MSDAAEIRQHRHELETLKTVFLKTPPNGIPADREARIVGALDYAIAQADAAALQKTMSEEGVAFNSEPIPPREYLMRRSYNPNDAQIPGAVVRERGCDNCGHIQTHHDFANSCNKCFIHTHIHSVDVPLVKEDGSRWT